MKWDRTSLGLAAAIGGLLSTSLLLGPCSGLVEALTSRIYWGPEPLLEIGRGEVVPNIDLSEVYPLRSARSDEDLEAGFRADETWHPVDDWNGDGLPELVGVRWESKHRFLDHAIYAVIRVLDGRSKEPLIEVDVPQPFPRAFVVRDCDGDGRRDVLMDLGQVALVYGSAEFR